MSIPDEEALIRAAKGGDHDAFNQLVLAYQDQVYALAYRLLGNGESAADATQETFLSAFQYLHRFHKGSLRAWLLRITTNQCYDMLRRRQSHPTASLDAVFTQPESPDVYRRRTTNNPETYAERRELITEIQRGLQTLSPGQRVAVVLCDVEGFSYREAAKVADISLGTLKSRLSRGRGRLREYFFDHWELLPASLRFILRDSLDEQVPPAGQPEEQIDETT